MSGFEIFVGINIRMLSRITDFEIKEIDINYVPDELFIFAETCQQQGLKNNSSISAMKLGRWGNEAWWATWVDNRIVSVSGCHSFDQYEKDCWRLMVRTATLKEYRGRAPGKIKEIRNDFNWGHILPFQVKYAKALGAKRLVFTTNSNADGDSNSYRTNKAVKNVLEAQGLVKLLSQDASIFNTIQNVWEIVT